MPRFHLAIPLAILALAGCATTSAASAGDTAAPLLRPDTQPLSYTQICEGLLAGQSTRTDTERLHALFEANWAYLMAEFPTWASYVGHPGHNDRWTNNSPEAIDRREAAERLTLKVVESIHRPGLSPEDQLNYDLFERQVRDGIAYQTFPTELLPLSQMDGVQQNLSSTLSSMPTFNAEDYADIMARLKGVPEQVDQAIALMRRGLEAGITPPRIILRDVPGQIEGLLSDDLTSHPMMMPFKRFPASMNAEAQRALIAEAQSIVRGEIQPAFKRLHTFLVDTYLPGARESIALSDLPNGQAWYAQNVKHHTTTNLSPQEIHDIGLNEVARIRKEMDAIIAELGFEGDFAAFTTFLRTDPQFYFDSPEALLAAYRDIAKRADPMLITLFGHLPRLPYGVKAIPDHAAPSQTTAFYYQGSLSAGRPGWFYANTYDLPSRPRWEMEALTLHEAVPGHHFQISIAQELEGLPAFRQQMGTSAFVEGWGLYAESLGYDMGLYADPYSRFGQLTYEMWRAVRLVVDTGMHAMGWSRDEAIAYFVANTGKSEHDIVVEIDRYIAWPGQALAYKVGQLKIADIRQGAEASLGEAFNIRAFHDALLAQGALPLDLLEAHMNHWIASQGEGH